MDDGLPKLVCSVCLVHLDEIDTFLSHVKETQVKLGNMLQMTLKKQQAQEKKVLIPIPNVSSYINVCEALFI